MNIFNRMGTSAQWVLMAGCVISGVMCFMQAPFEGECPLFLCPQIHRDSVRCVSMSESIAFSLDSRPDCCQTPYNFSFFPERSVQVSSVKQALLYPLMKRPFPLLSACVFQPLEAPNFNVELSIPWPHRPLRVNVREESHPSHFFQASPQLYRKVGKTGLPSTVYP